MIRADSTNIWANAIFLEIFDMAVDQLSNGLTFEPGFRDPPS